MQTMKEQNAGVGHTLSAGAGKVALVAGGIGLGAALMYIFDPERGRDRRAKINDQVTSKVNGISQAAQGKAKDLTNRAKSALHQAQAALPEGLDLGAIAESNTAKPSGEASFAKLNPER